MHLLRRLEILCLFLFKVKIYLLSEISSLTMPCESEKEKGKEAEGVVMLLRCWT